MSKHVWFITGASTGLGKALVEYLLTQNCRVTATARNPEDIKKYVPNWEHLDNLLILALDVTNKVQVQESIDMVVKTWHTIDVLVNNAGYAYFSSVECADDRLVQNMFNVNFWGIKNMLDNVLPIMRKQHHGYIMNVSSLGGLRAFAGFGYYHATKFALEGLTESLALEVNPLGIDVTLIEPGDFNTDFASRSAIENKNIASSYINTAGRNIKNLKLLSGNQPGDPNKAAKVIYELQLSGKHPLRLLLGSDAYVRATEKVEELQKQFKENYSRTVSTDFE
ncbi:SDR family NAD(P)-dependent oxidoreductase [Leuconostoc sp. C2]|uniref:SDR family NAD(P)-dependent oxidoreductase n=1 Tax=Leuconostoc sp. (strain C2) TaxID=979982 RepID=UPI0002174C99|nr:SDR family NAD(P)-dependent oxidoreductase [Leuconostoc sp. C2]AEJ30455.1 short chain dehydrogenase [Leuconostoc sp. C2]